MSKSQDIAKTPTGRAMWLLMESDIMRYLMSNTAGRLNGYEKAERHSNLCQSYCKVHLATGLTSIHEDFDDEQRLVEFIHDWTQTLTSYLDSEIGFPIDDHYPNYETLAQKFFKRFIELCDEAVVAAREQSSRDDFDGVYSHIRYLNSQRIKS